MPTLGGVGYVVGVVCSGTVLAVVLVAVDVTVLVHGLYAADCRTGLVAVDVAVAFAVLMTVNVSVSVAMLAGMLVTVVVVLMTVVVCFRHTSLLVVA